MDAISAIKNILRQNARIDMVLLSPSVTNDGNVNAKVLNKLVKTASTADCYHGKTVICCLKQEGHAGMSGNKYINETRRNHQMYLYLPVALTSINVLIPVGLGLAVGLLSGLFGVGGGFLMTPLLIMLGIPATVAAATDSNQIVAASTSGTYAHWKIGNVDFKMGLYLLVGGFVGGLAGVQGIKVLKAMGNADFVIKITYVLMLGIVGTYMFLESLQSMKKKKKTKTQSLRRRTQW